MPIKLNPCAKCGRVPIIRFDGMMFCIFGRYESMNCPNCGMDGRAKVARVTKSDAQRQWNAANPKEDEI